LAPAGSFRDLPEQFIDSPKYHAKFSGRPRPICEIENRCSRSSGTVIRAQNIVSIGNVRAYQFAISPFRASLPKPLFVSGMIRTTLTPPTLGVERRPADTPLIDERGNVELKLFALARSLASFMGKERGIADFLWRRQPHPVRPTHEPNTSRQCALQLTSLLNG
jgi:hypothetical protein